jgi:glucans biosynthesis protein
MKHKPQMMKMRWLGAAVVLSLYTSSALAFNIDDVAKQAKSMAGKSYEAPKSNLPSVFRDMKYADYQQIQFNHDKAYWSNIKTPFKLEFYHQGMYFDTPVAINEVTATAVRKIKYSPDYFNFGNVQHDKDTVKDRASQALRCFTRSTAKIKTTKSSACLVPAISA